MVSVEGTESLAAKRISESPAIGEQLMEEVCEREKRGVGKDLAAKAAGSAHGPWQLANSPALAIALPNAYLASLGVPPLTVR